MTKTTEQTESRKRSIDECVRSTVDRTIERALRLPAYPFELQIAECIKPMLSDIAVCSKFEGFELTDEHLTKIAVTCVEITRRVADLPEFRKAAILESIERGELSAYNLIF